MLTEWETGKVCQLCQQTIWHVLFTTFFYRYLMDGAESSSESDMEEENKSEEEMNIMVKCLFFFFSSDTVGKKDLSFFNVPVILMRFSH